MVLKKAKWLVPLSVAIALVLFLWPKSGPYEADIFVPLDITALPAGLALKEMPPHGVEIRVRGPEKAVRHLLGQPLAYRLDLSGTSEGVTSIPIRPERFGLPREVAILHAHPDPLIFSIEREINKEVAVVVTVTGSPAPGFYVAGLRPIPSTVVLRGPKNGLDPVETARTKPIDVSGFHESTKKEVALDLIEGVVPVGPGTVILAELTIAEKEATRTFAQIPVTGKNARYRFTITPPQIGIEVKAPVNTLKKLETDGIEVYVDLQGLTPGVYPRRAVIALPVDATLMQAKPEIFTVKIQPRALSKTADSADPNQ
jgi:hypothetical protein